MSRLGSISGRAEHRSWLSALTACRSLGFGSPWAWGGGVAEALRDVFRILAFFPAELHRLSVWLPCVPVQTTLVQGFTYRLCGVPMRSQPTWSNICGFKGHTWLLFTSTHSEFAFLIIYASKYVAFLIVLTSILFCIHEIHANTPQLVMIKYKTVDDLRYICDHD